MKYIKTAILIAGMAAATAACTRKPVVPEFSMLSIDTLIGTPANGCKIEFRFATIANAAKSPALRSIEAANAELFLRTGRFRRHGAPGGRLRHPPDRRGACIPRTASNRRREPYEISAEAEVSGHGLARHLYYQPVEFHGRGARHVRHGMSYLFAGRRSTNYPRQTCFPNSSCTAWKPCCARNCYEQYEADSDEELAAQGFFPEYISLTENFQVTPEGITFYYNPYDHRMLCTGGRRSDDDPRRAGESVTSLRKRDGRRAVKRKKAGVSRLRPFSLSGNHPLQK